MEPNYTISGYATCTISADGRAITCHRCTMTSDHPMDVAHRYCATCKLFHQEVRMIPHDAASADSLLRTNADLRSEIARLQAALAWYADVGNYDDGFAPGVFDPDFTWHVDCGSRARAALKEKETT